MIFLLCEMRVKLLLIKVIFTHSFELKKNKDCLKQSLESKCDAIKKKPEIFEDVVKNIRATLMTEQFFCGKVTLNTASLHSSVKAGNCKPNFFTEAEECAETFREKYTEAKKKISTDVCK